jgi:thiamine pyrophosphate-dependent acetolactate synthase large subunit-like protein
MTTASNSNKLDRREVVMRLLRDRRELIAVSSLGSPTYDLAAAGDHDRNFYLWGAMGGAVPLALGLALAQPQFPIAVFIGDGEALMSIGSFATLALQQPTNLSIVILDNGLYGETGAQISHTASVTDLAAVARACGIAGSLVVENEADVEALAERINAVGSGPTVAVVKIDGAQKPRCLPSRDGVLLKTRVRAALGFEPM